MKKTLMILLAFVLAVSLSTSALAAEEEEARVIRVSGSAVVSVAADTASLQIGVNTQKPTVQEAQKENAALMAAVMEAIKKVGVDEKDLITSQFNVYTGYEYGLDSLGRETRKQYYEVQNNVLVTVHDLSLIGTVLDAAMAAGANTTYGITFSSTQANEAYRLALTRAVEDAITKAELLAAAAHVQLDGLVRITATQDSIAYARDVYGASNSYAYAAKDASAGTTITSGDISVSADVVLEYAFK